MSGSGSLRRRLAAWLVAMAVGSLLLAVVVTGVLARSTARADARRDLTDAADGLERLSEGRVAALANLSRRFGRVMDVDGIGVVFVTADGQVIAGPDLVSTLPRTETLLPRRVAQGLPALPDGVDPSDLDGGALWAGTVQTGGSGRLVFAARPLQPLETRQIRPVAVLTRRVAVFPLGRSGPFLLLAAGLAAAVAGAVAVWLAQRLTRPLQTMERTTRAIAGGDLGARVGSLGEADGELARLGAAIDAMATELQRAEGLERAFLMSVSHDLRTPLTSIRGYAEAIAEGATDDDESRRRAAAIIGAESQRLERLVADLLDLARLDTREFSLHPRPVDAAAVVAGAVEALRPAAADAGLRLTTSGPGTPAPLVLDPERLAQVVANLVENALKYAAASVEVRVGPAPAGVVIEVTDDGPGIDPADVAHVFERLYTAGRQAGRKVGTGLGLAIVAQLAEAMGGTAEASRTADGRTCFTVTVAAPAAGSSSSSGDGSSWSSSASASSSWSRPPEPSS